MLNETVTPELLAAERAFAVSVAERKAAARYDGEMDKLVRFANTRIDELNAFVEEQHRTIQAQKQEIELLRKQRNLSDLMAATSRDTLEVLVKNGENASTIKSLFRRIFIENKASFIEGKFVQESDFSHPKVGGRIVNTMAFLRRMFS